MEPIHRNNFYLPRSAGRLMNDPFESFERSRAGLLIPVLLFGLGAVSTIWMINTVIGLDAKIVEKEAADGPLLDGTTPTEPEASPNTQPEALQNTQPSKTPQETASGETRTTATEESSTP